MLVLLLHPESSTNDALAQKGEPMTDVPEVDVPAPDDTDLPSDGPGEGFNEGDEDE